jgi:hypothetical protein
MKLFISISRIAALVCISFTSFAQSANDTDSLSTKLGEALNKVFNTKIDMVIDSTVFPTHQANFYFNEEEKAVIMTLVAPQSFAKAEEHFEKQTNKDGYKMTEKKKFTHDGRNFLYQKGILKKDGEKLIMYLYAIEDSEDATIFFTGMHMPGTEKKFFPVIERAALSAKIAK